MTEPLPLDVRKLVADEQAASRLRSMQSARRTRDRPGATRRRAGRLLVAAGERLAMPTSGRAGSARASL